MKIQKLDTIRGIAWYLIQGTEPTTGVNLDGEYGCTSSGVLLKNGDFTEELRAAVKCAIAAYEESTHED